MNNSNNVLKNNKFNNGIGKISPMKMVSSTDKPKNFKATLKQLLNYLKPFKIKIFLILFLIILSTSFTIIAPKVLSIAMDSIETTVKLRLLDKESMIDYVLIFNIISILLILYLFSACFNILMQYIALSVSQKIIYNLRLDMQKKLSRLPISFFDNISHGEILSRTINDIENIASTLQENLIQFITGIIILIGVFSMMLTLNYLLALIIITIMPLYFFTAKPIIKRAQNLFKKRLIANGNLNSLTEETYGGLKTLKAFNKENSVIKKFNKLNNKYCDSGWKAQFITGTIMPISSFLSNLSYVFICTCSGVLFAMNIISLGAVTAFLIYAKQLARPINQITAISNSIQASIASAERVFEILNKEEEKIITTNKDRKFKNGDIVFKNVYFNYTPDIPLIENFNLTVKKGQTIAIVGPTGAGKTTLVNLLMRFYKIDSGEITIDKISIKDYGKNQLRQNIGMVLQETWLFNDTIMENIKFGKKNITNENCIEAAKKAEAHHFISTLPNGYNTLLNEESTNISQGQKQLITIARTLLLNPSILILDEATSNVDTLTEQRIQDGMNKIMKNRTCFVIAHRLSTIKNSDKILVLDKGKIAEIGTHKSLLKKNCIYADLYNSQFKY